MPYNVVFFTGTDNHKNVKSHVPGVLLQTRERQNHHHHNVHTVLSSYRVVCVEQHMPYIVVFFTGTDGHD
jgi:hypothetical protein